MARPSHSDHVLQQLNSQREWGFLCDCLIAIGDFYFRAHKAVLAACSSYFRMMFIRDQQGAARLDLSNMQISAECFDLILQLMYLGRIAGGGYEFQELKASMAELQMYYVPDSPEDLRGAAPDPAASSAGGKMMFGVRMYEKQRPAAPEAEQLPRAGAGRPAAAEEAARLLAAVDGPGDQPCDLRKRPGGRSSALKDRPRFGRTYTCDDCGFVFSCEKLLIEHILTCTNRKAFHRPGGGGDDSSKAGSSASESVEEHRVVCKGEDDWPEAGADSDLAARTDGEVGSTPSTSVKTEPEESAIPEMEAVRLGDPQRENTGSDRDPEPGVSGLEAGEPLEGRGSSSDESGAPPKLRKVKEERRDGGAPCELCGALLAEEDPSAHYLAAHMGHICACGRCGQVLIKGRRLQEHAERCGESDSHGEDDSLPSDRARCGPLLQNQRLEHGASCHDREPFRPALPEEAGDLDRRRKHFCGICGKGFYQRCHLREHYTVHTKEKLFSCAACGKQFLRERQLRLHTDMHKGTARYVCPVCDQGTFLKHDHVRHMISHLAAGETLCQVCFQMFPGGEQLEQHMDVHLYVCGVCGEKFRLRKDMRSHYNSKHTKRL
ncbi:zinc finger and BTB domain-containing protein 1 [Pseudoliparis swirei]|uniref:zinc finger and BTB domain-containing protein 1 n=1 Tax=Pseudoliparis swirei TaxID=2059687 RepID=UPI0024BD9ED5|nr:zinc finger and BTB domain-containing protein 1 [Pseudoliparis swirei]